MATVVRHPNWCDINECRVRPDGSGEHWSRPVELETAGQISLRVRILQDGRRVGATACTPATTLVYLDYYVPEIGDVPDEDYVLPLDIQSAAALGNALVATSEEAQR